MIRQSRISKASGLRAVHNFSQGAVEEGVLHVELMNWPVPGVSQSENCADCGWLDDGTECLVVINTGALSEPPKNPASFVSVEGAISMKFVTENALPGDHIGLDRTLNKIPGVVGMQSSTFFFHGLAPAGISQSITVGARNWGEYLGV